MRARRTNIILSSGKMYSPESFENKGRIVWIHVRGQITQWEYTKSIDFESLLEPWYRILK